MTGTPVTADSYSCYGYITRNHYSGSAEASAEEYLTYDNIFLADGAEMSEVHNTLDGNTFIPMTAKAKVSASAEGVDGSGVTVSYTVREGGSILNADEYTIDFEITGDALGNSFTLEVTEADEPVDPDEPTDPDEPVDPETPAEPSEPAGFPGWAIAVIVCGALLAIAAVIAIVVVAKKKGKKGDAEGR